jgi:hypothetical protein
MHGGTTTKTRRMSLHIPVQAGPSNNKKYEYLPLGLASSFQSQSDELPKDVSDSSLPGLDTYALQANLAGTLKMLSKVHRCKLDCLS